MCASALKQENNVTGSHMRACVMAALHQDFQLALQLGSQSETKQKFNEDSTKIVYFMNLLQYLSSLTTKNSVQPASPQELQRASIYTRKVNNPYLKLFYQIMLEDDIVKVFEEFASGTTLINLFDFLTLACKYLPVNELISVIKLKIESSIQSGNFDVIVLTGLTQT